MNEHDKKHLKRLEAIARMVERIYDAAAEDAAAIGAVAVRLGADGEEPFSFDDYPQTKRRMDELLSWLREQLEVVVGSGVADEWLLSEDKNDALVSRVLGATGTDSSDLPEAVRRRLFDRNEKGCEAFLKRKEHGLGLSERVWRATESVPGEMAMGIDMGIREGKPAAAMARDLKQYLKHPDKLFRRVRDERGILHLSKNAAAFHPGRGVYRSSYQNARRLAVTEVNTAYRTADHERWQQLDFVVGVEVHLSGNHTCKGRDGKPHKFEDICDQLAGKYPKDFKFTGWHPHCRCYATSILKTDKEIAEDTRKMLRGEPTDGESVNKVEDVPENFKEWVEKNEARIATARENGTLPGFVRENEKIVDTKGNGGKAALADIEPKQERSKDIHDLLDTSSPESRERFAKINERRKEYKRLLNDPNYKDVEFNQHNGGLKATHKEHNFDEDKGWYETKVQTAGYLGGHSVILEAESHNIYKHRNCEGLWDGLLFEIAGAETGTANNIRNALKHCAKKPNSKVAVIFFPNDNFSVEVFESGYSKYFGLKGTSQYHDFDLIYCIHDEKIIHIKKPSV